MGNFASNLKRNPKNCDQELNLSTTPEQQNEVSTEGCGNECESNEQNKLFVNEGGNDSSNYEVTSLASVQNKVDVTSGLADTNLKNLNCESMKDTDVKNPESGIMEESRAETDVKNPDSGTVKESDADKKLATIETNATVFSTHEAMPVLGEDNLTCQMAEENSDFVSQNISQHEDFAEDKSIDFSVIPDTSAFNKDNLTDKMNVEVSRKVTVDESVLNGSTQEVSEHVNKLIDSATVPDVQLAKNLEMLSLSQHSGESSLIDTSTI